MARASGTGGRTGGTKAGKGKSPPRSQKSAQAKRGTVSLNTRQKTPSVRVLGRKQTTSYGVKGARRKSKALHEALQATQTQLQQSLDYQAAICNILGVISRSHSDVQPIFKTIVEAAHRLCKSEHAFIFRLQEDQYRLVASKDASVAQIKLLQESPIIPSRGSITGRVALERRAIQVEDVQSDPEYTLNVSGVRTTLGVPLLRDDRAIGIIVLTRAVVEPFTSAQIDLVSTFATQALIAIENARLFDEAKAGALRLDDKVRELRALSDVTRVINSTVDLESVLDTIIAKATQISGTEAGAIYMFDRLSQEFWLRTTYGVNEEILTAIKNSRVRLNETVMGEAVKQGVTIQFPDIEGQTKSPILDLIIQAGFRSLLVVPLLDADDPVGTLVLRRKRTGEFSENTVEVMQTFAAQSVIAIRNARLFNETKEALERQTATADVLNIIGRSPNDAAPVFDVIGERAEKLCNAEISVISLLEGDLIKLGGIRGISREGVELFRAQFPLRLDRQTVTSRTISSGSLVHIGDVLTDPAYDNKKLAAQTGYRSCLGVPMQNKGQVVGAIFVARAEPGLFSDNEIQLLQIFADQAVIAIENVRLFKETQDALERQIATADILRVIASSPDDVQPVFDAIAASANRIVDGRATAVYSLVDDMLHLMSFTSTSPEADAALRAMFPRPLSWFRWGEAILGREVYQVPDMHDPSTPPEGRDLAERRGFRALMVVPLVSEQKVIGVISVTRATPGKFADNHIQLLQTFADQAVIAISNVGLFRELQQRTKDLSRSLDELRTAQDRLVQTEKLASLGQLTAGIAHEIKNPLNFVNNFAALSAELTGELNDVLKPVAMDGKVRGEVDELTDLLKDNLEKIEQHGRRADSIVKNMLLHSREGSGEQRAASINALVEESLNLAYHGARAEKSNFNITLQRDFDANAGSMDLFPQEITRALLNLISNGFYAATKRSTENGELGFEPTLLAATKNLGNAVEIRIRDNGNGIPPEVKDKMFNPFFTTKPAGEGTGLGLSMTHDIIVKQHGGRIDVATEVGQFTEFKIVLPRPGPEQ